MLASYPSYDEEGLIARLVAASSRIVHRHYNKAWLASAGKDSLRVFNYFQLPSKAIGCSAALSRGGLLYTAHSRYACGSKHHSQHVPIMSVSATAETAQQKKLSP